MVSKNLKRIIIAAVSENGVIGNNNKIPWYSKDELNHFKNTTLGSPIIMGRKTFDSIGKELNDRLNIIISKSPITKLKSQNILQFESISKAYNYLRVNKYSKVFICGGSRVYRNTIKHAEEMIISKMNFTAEGNVKFPNINENLWRLKEEKHNREFTIKYYVRRKMSS